MYLTFKKFVDDEEDLCVEKYTRWVKSDWGQMAQSNIFIAICTGYLHWGAHQPIGNKERWSASQSGAGTAGCGRVGAAS